MPHVAAKPALKSTMATPLPRMLPTDMQEPTLPAQAPQQPSRHRLQFEHQHTGSLPGQQALKKQKTVYQEFGSSTEATSSSGLTQSPASEVTTLAKTKSAPGQQTSAATAAGPDIASPTDKQKTTAKAVVPHVTAPAAGRHNPKAVVNVPAKPRAAAGKQHFKTTATVSAKPRAAVDKQLSKATAADPVQPRAAAGKPNSHAKPGLQAVQKENQLAAKQRRQPARNVSSVYARTATPQAKAAPKHSPTPAAKPMAASKHASVGSDHTAPAQPQTYTRKRAAVTMSLQDVPVPTSKRQSRQPRAQHTPTPTSTPAMPVADSAKGPAGQTQAAGGERAKQKGSTFDALLSAILSGDDEPRPTNVTKTPQLATAADMPKASADATPMPGNAKVSGSMRPRTKDLSGVHAQTAAQSKPENEFDSSQNIDQQGPLGGLFSTSQEVSLPLASSCVLQPNKALLRQ